MTWSIVARDPSSRAFGIAVTLAIGVRRPARDERRRRDRHRTHSFTKPVFGTRGCASSRRVSLRAGGFYDKWVMWR